MRVPTNVMKHNILYHKVALTNVNISLLRFVDIKISGLQNKYSAD